MADSLVVGKLRAVLAMDTAQYEAGARKAATVNARLTAEMRQTQEQIKKFAAGSKEVTFREMVAGMSAAGKSATSSAQLIRGMSVAGREAAAANLQVAQTSQAMGQRISALAAPLKSMAVSMGAAFAIGSVVNFAREIGEFAGRMLDLSAETGIATSRLQALDQIAAGAGLTVEDLAGAVTQLQRRLAGGDESAERAVEKLGFAVGELLDMAPDAMFIKLGEAIARVVDPAERARLVFELMGRTGTRSLRVMREDLGKFVDDVEKNGPIISDEILKAADAFDEFFDRLERRVKAGIATITGTLVAGAMGWRQAFAGALSENNQFGGRIGDIALPSSGSGIVHGTGLPARDKAAEDAARAARERMEAFARAHQEALEREHRRNIERLKEFDVIGEQRLDAIAEEYRERTELLHDFARAAAEVEQLLDSLGERAVAAAERDAEEWARFQIQLGEHGHNESLAERRRQMQEIGEHWSRMADWMSFTITDAFADMLVGLRSFKDAMIDIWRGIRQAIANILSQMLADFIGGYVRRAVAAMAGMAVAGGGASAASGIASGAAGAGAGAGLPGMGSLAGLASNPITWGIAGGLVLAWGIKEKGWFRGGEEGAKVNPRRDRFFGQFGPSGTGPGSGFSNAASFLNSPRLFNALTAADTVAEWEAAQSAAVGRLAMRGHQAKSFALGGFIPPGVVQPAILHGGSRGEVIMPVEKMGGSTHVVNNFTIQGWDGHDILRVVEQQVIPLLNNAAYRNTSNYASEHRKGFGIRPAYGAR